MRALVLRWAWLIVAMSYGEAVAHASNIATQQQAATITAVHIEGLQRIDREAVYSRMLQKPGAQLDTEQITRDLRRIWDTQLFKNIAIYKTYTASGVELWVVVEEKPFLSKVQFSQYQVVGLEDLKKAADLKVGSILRLEKLKQAAARIKDLYLEKGYFLADVDFTLTKNPAQNEVEVNFVITENSKIIIKKITLLGNRKLSTAQLKRVMQTQEGSELSALLPIGHFKQENLQNDILRLQALYYDHGFVNVKIQEVWPQLSKDRRYIYLTIQIEEGEQYRFGEYRFAQQAYLPANGDLPEITESSLRKLVALPTNQVFSRETLLLALQKLTELYKNRGYAYANITPNTRIDAASKSIDVEFEVDLGDEVFVERIDIVGNLRTRDKVIRRELSVFEGQRYSSKAIAESKARVFALGFFETCTIETQPGSDSNRIQLAVQVKEKSTGTFQVGAGFSSIESFIATAQISQNNFLGNGQMLAFSMQLSFGEFARQMIQFQFVEPYFLDSQWNLGLNAYINQRFYPDFQRNAQGVAPSFGYPLGSAWRLNMGYTFEYVEINQKNALFDSVYYNLNRQGRVSSMRTSLFYDTRNNRLFPSAGTFHELRSEVSSQYLGASELFSFERLELDSRYFYPLPWYMVFRANLQLGFILGGKLGIPVSERYFPGGIYSVRGFQPRALGPTIRLAADVSDPGIGTRNFVMGGNKQLILNAEIEMPIIPQAGLRGVLFIDAGNAYNDNENLFYINQTMAQRRVGYLIGSNEPMVIPLGLFYSFGFGFRWQSPMGPLRFEWGIPIVRHEWFAQPVVFEFTIGNFF